MFGYQGAPGYTLEDYFGLDASQLQTVTALSPTAPYSGSAGEAPSGKTGVVASFTDWRRSPVFWLAVFAVFALGMIHVEGSVKAALR